MNLARQLCRLLSGLCGDRLAGHTCEGFRALPPPVPEGKTDAGGGAYEVMG